ncbi:MAG TPA: PP2C family protein-serine/threonine phosphatase [Terriglobales bacterium]|nr:PP2C family protein-serine/threonine phosphatase [Terriglobales bacterium]
MTAAINSRAFEEALLRSERLRIFGAITIIAIFGISSGIRIYLFGSHMSHVAWYGAAAMVGYELLVLRWVERSLKAGTDIPDWFWTLNIIIEISMPALGVAFLVSDRVIHDYRALASPWVLLFFPFLILSTLRLSPVVSIIAGLVGSLEYIAAAYYVGWHIHPDLGTNSAAHSAVPFYAIMICACGFLAALVASEVRKHVEAALREAETERQLKQMEHDLTIARSIQQSLLPKVRPHIEGYEIAGWNRSADATGGDYFDWKQMEDGRLVVTLADVTGHGIGPALLASVCRAYARASFSNSDSLPNTLQRINQSFGEDLLPGRFATFVAAVCQPGSDKLELLSAGHAPLFWYSRSTAKVQEYDAHDVPLGILPKLTASSPQVLAMDEGDIVFLITDGFLEWENHAAEQFGMERFEQVVRSVSHLSPEEIIAELYSAVLKFADGTSQADDLTAVVIKRTAAAKPAVAAAASNS